MTDDSDAAEAAAVEPSGAANTYEIAEVADGIVTAAKDEIFEFLSLNNKVFFKSQQIDDPELTGHEKRAIAAQIFNESPKKFLLRFGKFLERKHLDFFENSGESNDEEIRYLIAGFGQSLKTRQHDIKNRRYAAMQSMIKADSYFSEREMMKREPHLYEQLIGQYLTDSEKRQRDQSDEEDEKEEEAFSRVLLKNYDKEQMEELRKQQARDDMSDDEDDNTAAESVASDQTTDDELFPKMPGSYRMQWGNFEDEPGGDVPQVTKKPRAREQRYITGAEREILRQEFLGIMYAKFLDGHDPDFDYGAVDDNAELDDLQQIGQDKEDKYFDADDDDDGSNERIARMSEDDSEDELDVYMMSLTRQPS